jgi:hypothetical protein
MSAKPKRLKFGFAVSGVAGILAGLVGGYAWRGAVTDHSSTVPGLPLTARTMADPAAAGGSAPAGGATVPAELLSPDAGLHRKALTEGIANALNHRQPAERMKRFLELMEHFRPGDSQAVVDGFREHDQKGRLFSAEYNVFMDLSGRMDGLAAMERIRTRYTSPEVTVLDHHVRCMTAWAETAPSDAIKWWNSVEDGSFRDSMAKSIIAGVVKTDMPRALEYLKLFPEEDRGQHAGAFVGQCLDEGGPKHAAEWLKSVDVPSGPTSPFHLHAAHALLSRMVNVSPAEKAACFEPLLDQPWFGNSGCLQTIIVEWAKKDAAAAGNWLAGHNSIPGFAAAAGALSSEWKKSAPQAAEEWWQRLKRGPE